MPSRLRLALLSGVLLVAGAVPLLGPGAITASAVSPSPTYPTCPSPGNICVSYATQWLEPFPGGWQAVHVIGQVHNETGAAATDITLRINLLDSSGVHTLASGTATSSIDVLPNGNTAPFELIEVPAPTGYTVSNPFAITTVTSTRSPATPYTGLSVSSLSQCPAPNTSQDVLCGTVHNANSGVAVHNVHVAVTFTDLGVMVSQDRVLLDALPNDVLQPNHDGTFEIDRSGEPAYDSFTVFPAIAEPEYPIGIGPGAIDFGHVLVGTVTSSQTVTVMNADASLPVALNSLSAISNATSLPSTDFVIGHCVAGDGTIVTALAAGASCEISVSFAPTDAGDRGALLTIATNEAGSPETIPLSGIGLAPKLSVSEPSGTTFAGQIPFGQSSAAALPVIVSNIGTAPMTFGVSLASELSISSTTCSGLLLHGSTTLAATTPPTKCEIDVLFSPNVPRSSSPVMTVNGAGRVLNAPQSITFSGYGIGPAVAFNPPSLLFADGSIPTNGIPVYITNTGNANLLINSISTAGPFTVVPCFTGSFTLQPGHMCEVLIQLVPGTSGQVTGALLVADNIGGHVLLIAGNASGPRGPSPGPPGFRTGPPPRV